MKLIIVKKNNAFYSFTAAFTYFLCFLLTERSMLQLGVRDFQRPHPDPAFDGRGLLIHLDRQLQYYWPPLHLYAILRDESITVSQATELCPLPL